MYVYMYGCMDVCINGCMDGWERSSNKSNKSILRGCRLIVCNKFAYVTYLFLLLVAVFHN